MKKITLLLLLFSFHVKAQNLLNSLQVKALNNNFYVFTTYKLIDGQPFPANGLFISTDSGVIIIDGPWNLNLKQALFDSISTRTHKKVKLAIVTHHHDDRTAALAWYKQQGILTYGYSKTDSICKYKRETRPAAVFTKDTTFTFAELVMEVMYPGPGHSADNVIIWFPEIKLLYGGCFIKSATATSIGNLSDANLVEWKRNCYRVQSFYPDAALIIPGHGDFTKTGSAPLDQTIQLLEKLVPRK